MQRLRTVVAHADSKHSNSQSLTRACALVGITVALNEANIPPPVFRFSENSEIITYRKKLKIGSDDY